MAKKLIDSFKRVDTTSDIFIHDHYCPVNLFIM